MIDQIKKTPVKIALNNYIPDAVEAFKDIDKETLIELILSREFKNFDFNPKLKDLKEKIINEWFADENDNTRKQNNAKRKEKRLAIKS